MLKTPISRTPGHTDVSMLQIPSSDVKVCLTFTGIKSEVDGQGAHRHFTGTDCGRAPVVLDRCV